MSEGRHACVEAVYCIKIQWVLLATVRTTSETQMHMPPTTVRGIL